MNNKLMNSQKGFSLIELLIVIALTGIVSASIYGAYWSQERVHKAQAMVSEMQSNAKLAMLIISKDVRMINAYLGENGMGWLDGDTGEESGDYIRGLKAWNNLDNGSDAIDIAYADLNISSPLDKDMPHGSGTQFVDDAGGFEEKFDDDGQFLVIITDYEKSNLMEVTNANASSNSLTFNRGTSSFNYPANKNWDHGGYGVGAMIFLAKFVSYRIDHSDPDHPTLEMSVNFDPNSHPDDRRYEPLTQDIEDLQVAYILVDENGVVSEVDQPDDDDYADVRAIRLSIVARTSNPVIGFSGSNRPALEDNPAGTSDDYQRRVITETFLVRNLNL